MADLRAAQQLTRTRPSTWQRAVRVLRKDRYLYLIFLLPFLYFLVFHYLPIYGVIIAFKNYKVAFGIWGSKWVGLQYFIEFLTDPYAWKLIRNTMLLSFYSIVFGFPIPIILALLLNELQISWFKRVVQTVSYLPHFISVVVVAGMVVNFLSSDGLVNRIIVALGGESFPWLMQPRWFPGIYVISGIWQHAGWSSIIYLAALSAIDPELYEAATIDGAGRFQQMRHITLPGIAPTITILLILDLGRIMSVGWEKILLLYTGATYETADVLQTYIYRRGLEGADFSYATAVGVFQGLVGLAFVVGANYLSRRLSDTSLW
ncbi:MAG: ABC transporter permease subunit [Spirochaetaceae bacterium]|nr:ABC transporter permease subunit [Spirochaetaceae bacterium]